MKYFNIKRYKFSTVTKNLGKFLDNFYYFFKFINYKKIYNSFDDLKRSGRRITKYFNPRRYNIIDVLKKIQFKTNKYLFFHLPAFIIFFSFLYIGIPKFYNYDKSKIESLICVNDNIECIIRGKLGYNFFPTPRLVANDLIINIIDENKSTLVTVENTLLKLSFKNLLAKEKHKIKKIEFKDFESSLNLKKLKNYNLIFKNKISTIPFAFKKGKISLYEEKDYVASIHEARIKTKFLENHSELQLKGKFLNDNIIINLVTENTNDKTNFDFSLKMKNSNFLVKSNFFASKKNIIDGNFLLKKDKNKISGIFEYENSEIKINKSNVRNIFADGKILGKIKFLPYFKFDLDVNLNSINFTRLYNYFLSLDEEKQKKLFEINKKINGKLNFSSEKVYSKHNLVNSFESRIKFYNGNAKIEQFLINLGKLGAADILGTIDNDKKLSNFKFESNVFVDNQKKFLSKFGIYNKENVPSNLFVEGNFDFKNIKTSFYEISDIKKFNVEDVNFIENEFNDIMLENGFIDLFNFPKFKFFLKSVREDVN